MVENLLKLGGGITPTGTINITENGTVDVTNYASANVNVSSTPSSVVVNVENELWFCDTNNNATTTSGGGSYTATLTAQEDFTLTGATVVVKMGGVDITSTAYSNGTINISAVTADIKIYAKAVLSTTGCIVFGSASSFSVGLSSQPMWDGTLEYSTDKSTWTTWDGTTINAVANNGNYRVYLRGTSNTLFSTYSNFNQSTIFNILGTEVTCSGNIENLLDYSTVLNNAHPPMTTYCFCNLFYGCKNLITQPYLASTSLNSNCYYQMFGKSGIRIAEEFPSGLSATGTSCCAYMYTDCDDLVKAPSIIPTPFNTNCCQGMFMNCTKLKNPPTLSSIIAQGCYNAMFRGCISLETAPALPATNLQMSCYTNMFYGCTSLTTTPALPATTVPQYCYQGMFYGCTSLTTIQTISMTACYTQGCQDMFRGCTSLTTMPTLSATTLAQNCYQYMFADCIKLNTISKLPATTLATQCYQYMFQNCTSLKSIPSDLLPATTLVQGCYAYMFQRCASLKTAPELPATTLANFCYQNMFDQTGLTTAPELPATTLTNSCYTNMFSSCEKLAVSPALPATTIEQNCYSNMFNGCKMLNVLPELPAITLKSGCYQNMFIGCTNIKISTTQDSTYVNAYRIPYDDTETGTIATNALYNMFYQTGGTFKSSPNINTTYYTSNSIIRTDGTIIP